MKVVWSPETASKAYIDTVKSCELNQESGVAELISAMAAGWNSKLIVETWSQGNFIPRSIGLAIAARHTCGRHVCVVPDERSRTDYIQAMSSSSTSTAGNEAAVSLPEILVGEPEDVMSELEGVDFLVVDSRRRDFARFLRLARLSSRGAVLVCKNAGAKTASCGFKWRGILDAGKYRVVRTAFLPVGPGLDIAHVAASGSASAVPTNKRRWIRHVDTVSGEEHVIRTT